MDEETRRRRLEQIKRLEEMQAKYKRMLNEKLAELGTVGRMNFYLVKSFLKRLIGKK